MIIVISLLFIRLGKGIPVLFLIANNIFVLLFDLVFYFGLQFEDVINILNFSWLVLK